MKKNQKGETLGAVRARAGRMLRGAGTVELPGLEANLILGAVLGKQSGANEGGGAVGAGAVYRLDSNMVLKSAVVRRVLRLVRARAQRGVPMAYITGEREFYGRAFTVTPRVLVPRPESELLVDQTLRAAGVWEAARARGAANARAPRIHDCGTGSGAVAISIAAELPGAVVSASDVSAAALRVARKNCRRLLPGAAGVGIRWRRASLLRGTPAGGVDILAANLPYLRAPELAEPSIAREPRRALLGGGDDGLALIRRLVAQARTAVSAGGYVLLEAGPAQMEALAGVLTDAGFIDTEIHCDLAGHQRVITASKPLA